MSKGIYYARTYAVHAPYGKGMRYYPEVYISGFGRPFFSSDFQLMSEKRSDFWRTVWENDEKNAELWKLQGDILGSMTDI